MQLTRRTLLKSASVTAAASVLRSAPAATPPLEQFDYAAVQFAPGLQQAQMEQTHATLMSLSEDSILMPFRVREGLPAPGEELGGWYNTYAFAPTHAFGQWVSALSRYYAITGDEATRAKAGRLVQGYAATIEPEGKFYMKNRFPAYLYDKFVLGMIDAYEFAHDPIALATLERTTEAALPHLPGKAVPRMTRQITSEEEFGIHGWDESYTMPENLFLAAERTGRSRYKDMARQYMMDDSFFDPLARGEDVLAGRHAYSHVNALSSAAKAYLVLGDDKYLRAAQNGFRFVQQQSFATGGWGPDELFYPHGSGDIGESLSKTHAGFETPCGSYAHFKITRYLLRITKDSRYGDSMERVMYNTVLGAKPLLTNGSAFYYADYHFGGVKTYHPDKFPCCAGTLPQIAADYRISSYFRDPRGLFVNLYIPGTLHWEHAGARIALKQTGNYPEGGSIQFTVNTDRNADFALRLRIPEWAGDAAEVRVNAKRSDAQLRAGTFAEIQRTWKNGDRVDLELPLPVRLEAVDSHHPDTVALVKGPLVLFAIGDAPPKMTRKELMAAVGSPGFRPFTAIKDEHYSTYVNVSS